MKALMIYFEWAEHFQLLTDTELGQILRCSMQYAEFGELFDTDTDYEKFTDLQRMAFSFIRKQIDRDREKYLEMCEKNKANGKKGGRPKLNHTRETEGFFLKPKKANESDNKNESESEIKNDIEIKSEIESEIERASPFEMAVKENEELREALFGFREMRKIMKKPLTCQGETILIQKLKELSKGDIKLQKELLNKAIEKNWLSVYISDSEYPIYKKAENGFNISDSDSYKSGVSTNNSNEKCPF